MRVVEMRVGLMTAGMMRVVEMICCWVELLVGKDGREDEEL